MCLSYVTPPLAAAMTVGTLYRVGLRQKRGTGGDGELEASLAEGSAAFGSPFASSNTETFTTAADRLRFGATVGVAIDAWFDDVKLNSQSMPQANAAPGIPHATASVFSNLIEQLWRWLRSIFAHPEAAVVRAQVPAGQIWRSYYYAGSQRIALRVQTSSDPTGQVSYLLADHLGSTTVTTNSAGIKTSELRYSSWGGTRYSSGSTPTDYQFTGQRGEDALGIYYFNARWYDGALGRFLSADTIIPQPGNPQDWDRYSYVRNNPINSVDPSGHATQKYLFYDADVGKGALSPYQVTPTTIKTVVKEKFGIEMKESGVQWSLRNLYTAFNALSMADTTLNGHLGSMIGGTTFTITGGGDQYWGETISTGVIYHVANGNTKLPLINFLHETGHLLDSVPSTYDVFSDPLRSQTPTWVKDGYVNGELLGSMFKQPVQAIPLNEPNRPNEYWADAFANYVAGNINLAETSGRASEMYDYVNGALKPYANP